MVRCWLWYFHEGASILIASLVHKLTSAFGAVSYAWMALFSRVCADAFEHGKVLLHCWHDRHIKHSSI